MSVMYDPSHDVCLKFPRIDVQSLLHPLARPTLSRRDIHVHACSLDACPKVIDRCIEILSPAERERAFRYRFDLHRSRYVVAHGYLRHVLGAYCAQLPETLVLHVLPGGKPILAGGQSGEEGVRFSLTHSHDRALIAVSADIEVGVDLEQIKPEVDCLGLARRFFSRNEWQAISGRPPQEQRLEFFRHWVGKESVLKALGTGLPGSLQECELRFEDRWTARVVERFGLEREGILVRFVPVEGEWVGAVAAAGSDWRVVLCP